MFNFLKKDKPQGELVQKAFNGNDVYFISSGGEFVFADYPGKYLSYYSEIAPVGDSINKIAAEASRINAILYQPSPDEALKAVIEHPFLKLLKKPNPYQTWGDFNFEATVHEKACGNNYLYFTGGISANLDSVASEPVELYNLRPDLINIDTSDIDGRARTYRYSVVGGAILTFRRKEARMADGRLYQVYFEINGFGQLFHFKNISTRTSFNQIYGDSPLQDIELEISQYYRASVHNDSLLRNGLSAKKLISMDTKEDPSQSQIDKLTTFIKEKFSGSSNAGKSMVAPVKLKVDNLSMSLQDMDFKEMMKRTSIAIYNKLNIPLPLVSNDHSTMSNMEQSKLNLYDNAVLPAIDKFFDNLFEFPFKMRYKDANKFIKLGFDESAIPALQPRIFENAKKLKELGAISPNEVREYLSFDRIDNKGADTIYINTNQMPIGTDTNLSDGVGQRSKSSNGSQIRESVNEDADKSIAHLKDLMRKQKNNDGTAYYNEREIKEACKQSKK